MHSLDELQSILSQDWLTDKRPGGEPNVPGLFIFGNYSNEVQQPVLEGKLSEVGETPSVSTLTVSISSGKKESNHRAKRTVRKQKVKVKLTSRDIVILRTLRDTKFLSTMQLATFCFGRLTSTVRLRLRKLMDAGFIKSWVTSLNAENYYSLAGKGLASIEDENSSDRVPFSIPRRLERRLEHLLCVNDLRIALSLAIRKEGGEVTGWRSDWQIKRPGERSLVPDALFTVRFRNQEIRFALEVDLATEPAATVFAEKLRSYGMRSEILLVVVPTTRRLATLLDIAARESRVADVLFTVKDRITPKNILGKTWTSPRRAFAKAHEVTLVSLCDLFAEEGGERNG